MSVPFTIYDQTIPVDQIAARLKRDGRTETPVSVLVRRKSRAGREYVVRQTGIVLPDNQVVLYRKRRDGKIQASMPYRIDGRAVSLETPSAAL